jgi:hypothetical protein
MSDEQQIAALREEIRRAGTAGQHFSAHLRRSRR